MRLRGEYHQSELGATNVPRLSYQSMTQRLFAKERMCE